MGIQKNNILIESTPTINGIRAIQRYTSNLIIELDKLQTDIEFQLLFLGVKDSNQQIPNFSSTNIKKIQSSIPGKLLKIFWKLFNSPDISYWNKEPFDLIHFPGGFPYIPNKCNITLTTLHGFASCLIPEFIDSEIVKKMNNNLDLTIRNSTHFITVSETNKDEAIKLWGIPPEKITSIPLGISPEFKMFDLQDDIKQSISKKYNLPKKAFILFVGALEPHKNIKNIIISYYQLPNQLKSKYQLVFVGKETEYCKRYKEQIISLGLSDKVSFIDYIQPGSTDLAYLYNLAEVFVFPTFYEGWASPPLEAMKCGTPAIVSDIPSLRESTGGISVYPNPNDPKEIANKIQELLEDEKLYLLQQQKGIEFTKQYTWKLCAEKTLSLYEKILKE